MERKIGETFEFEGKKLQVKESERVSCYGCFFDEQCLPSRKEVAGECEFEYRTDKKEVIFVEATEQNQTEQPQELNLCEILKYCPEGEPLWSPLLGDVKLHNVNQCVNAVFVTATNLTTWRINHDATIKINGGSSPETMLYPSRTQRDWSKFTAPWLKKEKFDPKTLKPFDEVVVRNIESNTWRIEYFSHINERRKPYQFYCSGDNFAYCIPYNDDTKHLVGTKDEAPEFYRYWED